MKELDLYHGSPNKEVKPVYGLGNDKHDYGKGFYLTENPALAADTGRRYKILAPQFIEKYQVSTKGYDVIKGWRANASFFYIAKSFVRDEVDLEILPDLLKLGNLGIQYCIKTEKAFSALREEHESLREITYSKVNPQYTERDRIAREAMYELINSENNQLKIVFSRLI